MEILINHLGYEKNSEKKAVIKSEKGLEHKTFCIKQNGLLIMEGSLGAATAVDNWGGWIFQEADFS